MERATPTPFHGWLAELEASGRLLRTYTQNIDGLEERAGLPGDLRGPRAACRTVMLHGDVRLLACTLCSVQGPWDARAEASFRAGRPPPCPACLEGAQVRAAAGRRATSVGLLRPAITLYGEAHPHGEAIADLVNADLRRAPDLLLVAGTSLKVVGAKALVKQMARVVHESGRGGTVVLLNQEACAAGREWEGVFDYFVQDECDALVAALRALEAERAAAAEARRLAAEARRAAAAAAAAAVAGGPLAVPGTPSKGTSRVLGSRPATPGSARGARGAKLLRPGQATPGAAAGPALGGPENAAPPTPGLLLARLQAAAAETATATPSADKAGPVPEGASRPAVPAAASAPASPRPQRASRGVTPPATAAPRRATALRPSTKQPAAPVVPEAAIAADEAKGPVPMDVGGKTPPAEPLASRRTRRTAAAGSK
jgi:NAD-dependent SIR2 family protein deacetylase